MKALIVLCLVILMTLFSCNPREEIYTGKVIMQMNLGLNFSEIYFEDGSNIRVYGQPTLALNEYYTFVVIEGLEAKRIISVQTSQETIKIK